MVYPTPLQVLDLLKIQDYVTILQRALVRREEFTWNNLPRQRLKAVSCFRGRRLQQRMLCTGLSHAQMAESEVCPGIADEAPALSKTH